MFDTYIFGLKILIWGKVKVVPLLLLFLSDNNKIVAQLHSAPVQIFKVISSRLTLVSLATGFWFSERGCNLVNDVGKDISDDDDALLLLKITLLLVVLFAVIAFDAGTFRFLRLGLLELSSSRMSTSSSSSSSTTLVGRLLWFEADCIGMHG